MSKYTPHDYNSVETTGHPQWMHISQNVSLPLVYGCRSCSCQLPLQDAAVTAEKSRLLLLFAGHGGREIYNNAAVIAHFSCCHLLASVTKVF